LRACFVWRGVVFMIHLYLLYIYLSWQCEKYLLTPHG
jgi:hypothetical protein